MMFAAGVILLAVGLVALVFGVAGGILTMFQKRLPGAKATESAAPLAPLTSLIEALTEFVKALTAAPQWIALVAVGLALVVTGSWLMGGAAA